MILEYLEKIDTSLFYFLNVQLANPLFDVAMPFITNKYTWFPIWAVLIIGLLWKGGKRGRWAVFIAVLSVALADQLVNFVFKPYFHRIRPCNVVEGVHLLLNKKTSYSMPSSHAANFFAVAVVFSYFYRKYQIYFWFIAFLVAYSRVAVGVHYPFDILAGAICGIVFGLFWIIAFKQILKIKGWTLPAR